MKTTITKSMFILLIASVSVLAAGCGDDNPVTPQAKAGGGEEEIEILTPKKMKITETRLFEFPILNPDGNHWDSGITAVNRRPDTFFRLGNYKTSVQVNHSHGTYWNLDWDGGFARMNYEGTYKMELYDDDDGVLQGADDHMATVTIIPSRLYQKDNAKTFHFLLTGYKTKVHVWGEWVY